MSSHVITTRWHHMDGKPKSILMMGFPGSWSHYFQDIRMAKDLIALGHKVTLICDQTVLGRPEQFNFDGINILTYNIAYTYEEYCQIFAEISKLDPAEGTVRICKIQEENTIAFFNQLFPKMNRKDYDFAVLDVVVDTLRCLVEVWDLPHADYYPVGFYEPWSKWCLGADVDLSVIPMMGSGCHSTMDAQQQIINTSFYFANMFTYIGIFEDQTNLRKESLGYPQDYDNLKYSVQTNATVGMYPVPADMEFRDSIPKGGRFVQHLAPKEGKPLTGRLKGILDKHDEVMLFSMGTLFIVDESTQQREQMILDAVAATGIPTIMKNMMKTNGDNKCKLRIPDNAYLFDWLPQQDLLAHPKVKLFITHCGMNGLVETAYHGTKAMMLPKFGDQFDNAARLLQTGTGVRFDVKAETAETLREHILRAFKNKKMEERATALSIKMKAEYAELPSVAGLVDDMLRNGYETRSTKLVGSPIFPPHFKKFTELAGIEINYDDDDKDGHLKNFLAILQKMQSPQFPSLVAQAVEATAPSIPSTA